MLAQCIVDPVLAPEYCLTAERAFGSIMRTFTSSRFQQLRASRLVVALFALGLLGFSVAPCHATPQHGHPGTSHHGTMPAGDCGHCPHGPTGLDHACATVAAPDCASLGPAVFERLGAESQPAAAPPPAFLERQGAELQPAAAPPPAFPHIEPFPSDDGPVRAIRARDLPIPHASFQQRYCSYLK